ncbi:MAG: T9SS type A sorting domain-containing protein [Ignavibacteriaceae bacterium]|mgnify:CR=1 FL=1|nr:T9SS type A sorting domain-containing protein [Ignavibacterium sp.]MCC6256494.1 T9SS type A sorting domain-containing protein [Ignavibacteriaceae bacterium]HRN27334.1 T9SS type A sorting domain-containing protein [Ignavibacteriaceae bacterium]HRP93980.1 T9SS type A sorting domain-containing protein [Ignavibacteriaceae bacterium]HRQ55224.1 T9SS type A sorting domain-containing protein [Ignavibacteriaceae bacterium]
MKKIFTSEFLPKLQKHLYILGRKKKNIFNVFQIVILFFALSTLLPAQNINNKNALDVYKDFYIWHEKENSTLTDDSVLTVLGRWAWGPCHAIDTDSNFAYIGNGPTFHVLDISDPSRPEIFGEYLTEGYVYDIELRDKVVFVCIGRGLLILDVSNPALPEKISEISLSGIAISFALEDNFAYVTCFSGAMYVVDIYDLKNPVKRGAIGGGQLAFCVEAKDGYVYVGNPEFPPLVIIDATNPDSLSRVDFEIGGWGYSAFIKDTLLFLGVHGYTGRYFKIYSVSNPASPEFIGQLDMTLDDIMAITVAADIMTAYIRTQSGRLISVDISDLTQPIIIDEIDDIVSFNFGSTGISISHNTVFAAYYNGLAVVDVSRPDSLKLHTLFPTGGDAVELDSKGNLAFAACGLSGMWILDCSNPQKIKNIGNVNTGGVTFNVMVDDTIVYLFNWNEILETDTAIGLWIIDVKNPYNPKILTHYIPGVASSPPHSITKSNNYIFVTQTAHFNNDTILEIIDVSDIFNPVSVSLLTGNYYPHSISVRDSVLYMATSNRGLRIIDISDIYNPQEISAFWDSTSTIISQGYDNLLYTDNVDTFFVLDISNPIDPQILGRLGKNVQGSALNLKATKNYVYSAIGSVIDVSDSKFPNELTQFYGLAFGYDVEAIENLILISDRTVGIWLLRNNLITSVEEPHLIYPNDFKLLQNYPNPFNPKTTIEFEMPKRERILIEVFDLLGQKTKTLLNEELEKGYHKIEFNASGLSSGIYFYCMRTKETALTKKMVILR